MLNYVIGDATYPQGDGPKVIVHIVNNINKWGSGFVLAINKRWMKPREEYLKSSNHLGEATFVNVEPNLWIANVVGQHQTIRENPSPIRYEALREGLGKVRDFCKFVKASAHMPRIGSDRARGSWPIIEDIIEEELVQAGISVTVYDLPQ